MASAAYGFVRFFGGGLAPFAAGKLAEHFDVHVPFRWAPSAVWSPASCCPPAHRMLAAADAGLDEDGHAATEHGALDDVAGEVADEFGGAPAAIDSELSRARGRPS